MTTEYYHYSEEAGITRFVPRNSPSFPEEPPMVWAIDEVHRPLYYFPRDCPRIAFWKNESTTDEDVEAFNMNTRMVIVIEEGWFDRLQKVQLFEYTFQGEGFACFDDNAGYFTSLEAVTPLSVRRLEAPLQSLLEEGVELRIVPSLGKVKEHVLNATFSFSMIRLRNAKF